ncbi:NAD(P)H-dependent FMN reductase [Arthrobacter stackebrandtii]|uniref:NAD(P)H-dependent FMN reductase n=1 Tax=Arthrobacter stackebrandtii TaxID=272161 RepID=A0ABS4YTD7_9MICC|nr:NAD(P)H-dependent oxidoreductase [Arthrobacter stackebrandtii]MBP2411223.1 NAD(P)H-dependent FMN reductase [Arthrobacter stackebrandtii]PYH00062.1 oxidoreductase [Arthrobacter stackebrandtii]
MDSTTTESPLIKIIVGSVRPVRVGDQLAAALVPPIAGAAQARVDIVDLADVALPLLDEPKMPALGQYEKAHTLAWSEIVMDADAVIFLTPQYNGGYPASLKNAIDYLFHEWRDKPTFIISYGGHGGGMSAAQLRSVLDFIRMDVVADSVELTLPRDSYGADGRLIDAQPIVAAHAGAVRAAASALGRGLRNRKDGVAA